MASKNTAGTSAEAASPQKPMIDAAAFIAMVPMRPYDIIGDMRMGFGGLTLPLARYAYGGRVYAIDSDQKSLDALMEKAGQVRVGNIEPVLAKESDVPLEDGILDGVVISDLRGETSRPKGIIKEVARLLKKGGWLAIVSSTKLAGENGGARKAHTNVIEVAADSGFKKVTARPITDNHYLIVLKK